jgi:hypothetical protein
MGKELSLRGVTLMLYKPNCKGPVVIAPLIHCTLNKATIINVIILLLALINIATASTKMQ